MKIYIQENGWAGCIIVVAKSKEDAFKMMKDNESFRKNSKPDDLLQYEIEEGFIYVNTGDL